MNYNWSKGWSKFIKGFIDNEGYKRILEGLKVTAEIALFGFIIGIVIGVIIAGVKVGKDKNKVIKVFSYIGDVYVTFFRGTPIIVQLLLGHFLLFPLLGIDIEDKIEAILIFGLNSGAYVSEIIRSGILSIDKGQLEAGRALGLSYTRTMAKIVLPQAFKNSLPTLLNELIALVKDTSVASMIAVIDLTNAFQLLAGGIYEYIVPYVVLAVFYLVIVLTLTLIAKLIERRLRKSDKS